MEKRKDLTVIGWREWVSLPALGLLHIKAKIDTGARTSALHAFSVEPFKADGKERVRFAVHPIQRNNDTVVVCTADVYDQRWVMDSSGHRELRYVFQTTLQLGENNWPIEITLTNRDTMRFRMLLGRATLQAQSYLVDPTASYLLSR